MKSFPAALVLLIWCLNIRLIVLKKFPIEEAFKQNIDLMKFNENETFIMLPERQEFQKYLCGQEATCCQCSEDCMKTQTCCIDKLWNETRSENISDYLQNFMSTLKLYKKVSCQPVVGTWWQQFSKISSISSYLMIADCPEEAMGFFKSGCMKPESNSTAYVNPVIGSDDYIYKNSYCAICNNITSFELLELTSSCVVNNESTVSEYCSVDMFRKAPFDLMSGYDCDKDIFDESDCPISSPFHEMCSAFKGQIDVSYGSSYKNIFCYYCKINEIKHSLIDCFGQTWEPPTYSLSQTFSLKENHIENGKEYLFSKAYTCGRDEVYNFATRKCEAIDCPLAPAKCYSTATSTSNMTCVEAYWLTLTTNLLLPSNLFNTTFGVQIKPLLHNVYQSELPLNKSTLENNLPMLLEFSKANRRAKVFLTQYRVSNNSFYDDNALRSFDNENICANMSVNSSLVEDITICLPRGNHAENFILHIRNGSVGRTNIFCYIFHKKPSCKHSVILNAINKNGTLVKVNDPKTGDEMELDAEKYIPISSGIAFCIEDIIDHFADVRAAEYYISLTGTYASIICYVAVIFTFTYFRKLRSVPNYNNVGACAMLLISDIFFLIATQADSNYALCRGVGVLMHASLLSVQCWVVIISVDISRKIRSMHSAQGGFKIFRYYVALGILPPFVLVLILYILDNKNIMSLHYGYDNFCWINDLLNRILFYVVPCIAVFLFSLTMFLSNMYTIAKVKNETKKMMGKSGGNFKELSILAFKLIIILGLSEFIGFIQIPNINSSSSIKTFNAVFSISYAMLRSFRGVCIAVIYLLNKQTVTLYQEKIFSTSGLKTMSTMTNGKIRDSRL